MAVSITDQTVEYVAALAKLELSEAEKERTKKDLEEILGYMDTMNELDTEDVEPMSHVNPVKNVFREDVVINGPDRENILSNAPEEQDGCAVVPPTFN
ncbi:MAG: Asp-tRNA(Asn)/Glu-tRNA(Gln) amidotransferase subunit GatC [Lachnospiraceae bacterium]|nr:Asp-tRNA(Asn)/Glu-tRNA(Gln) amidotransferase subunit GatC [Lachnospiraceae bacterium]